MAFFPLFGRNSIACMEYYTIFYMLSIAAQMMLDAALFQILLNTASSEDVTIDLYPVILIPVHCLQATLQFLFGFDLYKGIIKASFRCVRNWRMIFLCLLAIEFSVFIAYIALASFFSIFTYVTFGSLIFKVYLIWPLKLFLEDCHEICVPLARSVSGEDRHNEKQLPTVRPGPSGYQTLPSQ